MDMSRVERRALAGLAVLVLSGACAQPVGSSVGTTSVTSTPNPLARAQVASSITSPPDPGIAARVSPRAVDDGTAVVTRVRVPITVADTVHLDPPPATPAATIRAGAAFATARRYYGDPQGDRAPRVALTSYTNATQGDIQSDGSVRLSFVHRLTWAVIDHSGGCLSSGGPALPPDAPPRPPERPHPCLSIVFVDAQTGRDLGAMVVGGPDISLDDLA